MPRAEGFAVMDVSTSVCDDPKFRRLFRQHPQHVAVGFCAYIATMAESWRAGKRVTVEEAWPAFLPFDRAAADVLIEVGLLDQKGLVATKAWRSWYEPARKRRDLARDRWTRYNAKRDADTTDVPRGSDVGTTTSVPLRPSGPSGLSAPSEPTTRTRGKNGSKTPEEERRDALTKLSEDFQAGRINQIDYERERRILA